MASTFVYAIHNPNKSEIKIGYSSDPLKRLSQLQSGTTDRLDILSTFAGGIFEEKQLHELLRSYRLTGEWFAYTNEVLEIFCAFSKEHHPKTKDFEDSLLQNFVKQYLKDYFKTYTTKKRTRIYLKDIKKACADHPDATQKVLKDLMINLSYKEEKDVSRAVYYTKGN